MQSKNSGEVFVVDLSDISQYGFHQLRRYNDKLEREDRLEIERIVFRLFDEQLSSQMRWTGKRILDWPAIIYDEYRVLFRKHPNPIHLLEELRDKTCDLLHDTIELPTWRIVHTRPQRATVLVELGEDYRIADWMKRHYEEFSRERR